MYGGLQYEKIVIRTDELQMKLLWYPQRSGLKSLEDNALINLLNLELWGKDARYLICVHWFPQQKPACSITHARQSVHREYHHFYK